MDMILASTSPYRRALLARLQLAFNCVAPDVDESPRAGESPQALAQRLSLAKAEAVAQRFPGALVIGSDQVAALGNSLLGKPGNATTARAQLARCAGRKVIFHTGVALVGPGAEERWTHIEEFTVQFRELAPAEIARYVEAEQPLDCAGSFKVEGLGIALFEGLSGRDPSSLEGLPLIALSHALRAKGLLIP